MLVRNERSALRVWLHITDDIHPGIAVLPGKWWSLPEETGAVANELTPSAMVAGGQPPYSDTFIEVVPVTRDAV